MPSAGKLTTGAKRGKTNNWCQARENLQLVPSAEKLTTGAKRGKTNNWCQARENLQLVPSAGKLTTGAKRGETYNWCQARENLQLVPSAGKLTTGAQARENVPGLVLVLLLIHWLTNEFQSGKRNKHAQIDHFTVVGLVTWPLNGSVAGVDLVLIQTSLLLLCKSSCSYK